MKTANASKLPVITVTISFIFWFGLYFGLYFLGWPGEAHPCTEAPYCFCETVHADELAAQKSNTWSDLGFVFAAIFIAFQGSKHLKQRSVAPENNNPKNITYGNSSLLIAVYAAAIFYMGPGSMFFHGAMTQWGGWLDVISMYVFVFFIISYLAYRSWNLTLSHFFISYISLCLFAIALAVFTHDLSARVFPLFAVMLVSLALLQTIPIAKLGLGRKKDLGLDHKWLVFSLAFFGAAIAIWTQSDTGGALCYPDSLWQGHAAWHLLSACMTVCIHFYFLSENKQRR
jgi:hypothetical protein